MTNMMLQFLRWCLEDFDAGCIMTESGEVLHLKAENLADIGTLGVAAQTAYKYIPLQMGDVALLNDPYSGGTTLSYLTLITPLILSNEPKLFLAVRTGFRPRLSQAQKLDEEGLRVPPMPLAQNFVANAPIMAAITSHPMAPELMKERIDLLLAKLENVVTRTQKSVPSVLKLGKSDIKKYFEQQRESVLLQMENFAQGDTRFDCNLDDGEVIRLQLEILDGKIKVDFRGTSPSQKICLTDAATFGACFGAFQTLFSPAIEFNSATFSFVEVSSPLGSMLNSKYPSPTFKGMTDGTALVASSLLHAFGRILRDVECGMGGVAGAKVHLQFQDGKRFYDFVPGGLGAGAKQDGADAISLWLRNRLQPSIEEIERRFDLIVLASELRKDSGGRGEHNGGRGLLRKYQLRSAAEFTWVLEQTKERPFGVRGAHDGDAAEIFVKTKQGQIQLESSGTMSLSSGDIITVLSAGGGGYGDNKNS